MQASSATHEWMNSWKKFQQGNFSVLGDVFQLLYKELYYYGLKIVPMPDLVKDTIQDLFVDIWHRRKKMTEIGNIKAYLFIAVRRKLLRCIETIRKENKAENLPQEPFIFSVEDFLINEEDNSDVYTQLIQSMQKLTDRQREVILLRFNHELEFSEISMIMGINIQSVRNLLFRSLQNIRKDMNDAGIKGTDDIEVFLFYIFRHKK